MTAITLTHLGVTYANFTLAELIAAGVPQVAIDTAQAAERRELIKSECRRRIYSIASAEAQINISGAATAISAKVEAARTPDEIGFLATFAASLEWIMAMRAAVESLTLNDQDFLDDDAWPACPADVLELAAQY